LIWKLQRQYLDLFHGVMMQELGTKCFRDAGRWDERGRGRGGGVDGVGEGAVSRIRGHFDREYRSIERVVVGLIEREKMCKIK
jgi:hypothetical protein